MRNPKILEHVPKNFAQSVSEWDITKDGYSESKNLLTIFGIEKQISSAQAWWELPILSNAPIADYDPTIHTIKKYIC